MEHNYKNKIGEVPVGELYESVATSDGKEVTVNETIVSWDEPDLDHNIKRNGHSVNQMITTGIIDKIYKRPNGPEISIRGAKLGRLDLESKYIKLPSDRADKFLNANTRECIIEYWYDGTYDMEVI